MTTLRSRVSGPVDLLDLHAAMPLRYPLLLQSVAAHPQAGRYDVLFAFPQGRLEVGADRQLRAHGVSADGGDFFEALDAWVRREARPSSRDPELPFVGGWFLFLAYEAGALAEPSLHLPASTSGLPLALAVRCPAALIYDRAEQVCHLIAEQDGGQLQAMHADLQAAPGLPDLPARAAATEVLEDAPQGFLDGVKAIQDYLRAGDTFQVNLSRIWRARLADDVTPAELYRRLRLSNPAPFAGSLRWNGEAVLSSSPERLVQIDADRVQTRPIAGTRPRLADATADLAQRAALIGNLKERAEHVMLIDLERNDLGRVCEPGSVEVSELMSVESYAHVHHIVSNVRGRLRQAVGPGQVLRAVFPGGTITGCPKLRSMEIIAELEGEARGAYTGCMGYYSRDGRMDSNILIRSLHWKQDGAGARVVLRAGAGIVVDSDAQRELAETRAKARGLLLALGAKHV